MWNTARLLRSSSRVVLPVRALADDLARRFPEDTSVRFSYLPTLRALFALAENDPTRALEELKPALPYDLAFPGTAFFAKFGALYSAYVRGEAYLAARRDPDGAAEFKKILDHTSTEGGSRQLNVDHPTSG